MAQPLEPTLDSLPHPLMRYFVAIRPAFLSVTFVACLLGLATALHNDLQLDSLRATLTILFALCAHAGANVINDYYDAISGCDAANYERLFPYTGGSRVIQNGLLSQREMGVLGYSLLLLVIPSGLWLTAESAPGLIAIGLIGLLSAWAYSAPPCKLQARGLGEIGILLAWLLVVMGSDFVQRLEFSFTPVAAGLSFALLVANVLYINQFPDVKADAQTAKRTLVVRLGVNRARWGYVLFALLSYGWLISMVVLDVLPTVAVIALLTIIPSYRAGRDLFRHAHCSSRLASSIKLTILAATFHGLLLAATLVLSGGKSLY